MKALQPWIQRFEALQLRERRLAALAIAFVLAAAIYSLLVVPAEKAAKLETQRLGNLQNQREQQEAQREMLQRRLASDPDAAGKAELAGLQTEIDRLGGDLAALEVNLVSPEQMLPLLRSLLQSRPGRRLLELRALPPQSLRWQPAAAAAEVGAAALPAKPPLEPLPASAPGPALFRHGLELSFEDDYAGALDYLRQIEALPARLKVAELAIEARQWPRLQVRLRLYTLSLREGWVGV